RTLRVTRLPRAGPRRILRLVRRGLVRRGLVGRERRLRVVVAWRHRLDSITPACPPVEGREGPAVMLRERARILRIVGRVLAEDLRRIVVHRHGSSLLVLMGGRACG